MSRIHTPAYKRLTILGVALGLIGCQALPGGPPQPPALEAEATFTEQLLVDVDPFRASAFERPMRRLQAVSVTGVMRLMADFPKVTHDAATNRTTVTMTLTNAGDALNYLKVQVAGDRKVISPAWGFNATATRPGTTQTVDLVFDNPGGGSFTVSLSLTGVMAKSGALDVTPGSGGTAPTPTPVATPTPTPVPSATPTPAPTATPTAAPTATPTPAPSAPASGVVASASSSYGTLEAHRVVDGSLSTQWANDGYQQPEAWLTLDTGAVRPMSTLKVKMRPQSGAGFYRLEVSNDGTSYQPVTGNLKNTSWNLETKALPAGTQGRYLRIHFFNDASAPEVRFAIYETQLDNLSGGPAPAPTPTPTPAPTATPPVATGSYTNNFEQVSLGSEPIDFIDPNDEGYSYAWMPRLPWKVSSVNASQQFLHDNKNQTANLSFRRYRGTALGTSNGQLPNKYFAELDVTPIDTVTYWPTGDQGTQFYYLNPTNYVELLIKPNLFEVWVANNAQPFQDRGWSRIYFTSVNTAKGQTRKLGAEVDAATQSIKVYLDGQLMTTLTDPMLTGQAHYFALRGTGNVVAHDNLRIEPR